MKFQLISTVLELRQGKTFQVSIRCNHRPISGIPSHSQSNENGHKATFKTVQMFGYEFITGDQSAHRSGPLTHVTSISLRVLQLQLGYPTLGEYYSYSLALPKPGRVLQLQLGYPNPGNPHSEGPRNSDSLRGE